MWPSVVTSRAGALRSSSMLRNYVQGRGSLLGGRCAALSTTPRQQRTQRPQTAGMGVSASAALVFDGGQDVRKAFGQFQVYKGRGAMAVVPIRPTWRRLPNGGVSIERQGTILLEFAASAGERTYDWANKLTFAMNVTEIGTVLELPNQSNEFFHDSLKGTKMEGQMQKVLRVEPTPNGDGYFFSVNMNNKPNGTKSSVSVPVSSGEFGVIKRLWEYSLPHLIGFDEVFNCPPQVLSENDYITESPAQYPAEAWGSAQQSPPAPEPAEPADGAGAWEQYQQQASLGLEEQPFEPVQEQEPQPLYEPEEPYYQPSPDSADFQPPPSSVPPSSSPNAFGAPPPF